MFRKFLEAMRKEGFIIEFTDEIDKTYEIGRQLQKYDNDKIVEFQKVKESDFVLLGNVCSSREILARSMNVDQDELHSHLLNGLRAPLEPEVVPDAPFMENVDENPNINRHPVPKFFAEDAGFYYTSGLIVTKGLESGIHNSSIHRQLIIGDNETTARIVPRHLFHNIKVAEGMDKDLPIAVVFGLHPAVLLAASTPTEIELDEMYVANAMMSGELKRVELPHSKILVPYHSEVVYEGRIINKRREKEGPFVDITGSLDIIREEPVLVIDRVYYRNNPYFTTILPSKTEHFILMGLGREARIKEFVANVVPKVGDVYLSTGGGGWLHAIISVEIQNNGDGKNVIMAAFAAHASLKWVTVVNTDIDVFDPVMVEWATVTRTGENDIIIINKARGSSLDPARNEKEKVSIKVGIDALMDLNKNPDNYKFINIPE